MRTLLLRWLILSVAVGVTAEVMPGIAISDGLGNVILIAAIFGLVNAIVRPILTVLTCPFIILTFGLFILIINTLMLLLTAALSPALSIEDFWTAFLASLVISIISGVLTSLVNSQEETEMVRRYRRG